MVVYRQNLANMLHNSKITYKKNINFQVQKAFCT